MNYTISYSSNKHWYVRLSPDGTLKLTIPRRLKNNLEFQQKLLEKWQLLLQKRKNSQSSKIVWIGSEYVSVLGEDIALSSIGGNVESFLLQKLYDIVIPVLEYYSKELWIPFQKLSIKDMKSKWGSCSYNNSISLNFKLIHLRFDLIRYVCIHEICHLKEKNHWPHFWNLVEKYCPEYDSLRKELKKIIV